MTQLPSPLSATPPLTWQVVIENTGYLSFDQAWRHFGIVADELNWPEDIIVFKQALWQRSRFHQGAHHRHRTLLTEGYIHLYPWIGSWQFAGTHYGLSPDAIIHFPFHPFPILLEFDTGKENHTQWRTKLTAYRLESIANPTFSLWIIALGGSVRLSRLTEWVREHKLPIVWHLTQASALNQNIAIWNQETSSPKAPPKNGKTQSSVRYRLLLNHQDITPDEASLKLQAGWQVSAKEITGQGFLYYLSPG